MFDKIGTKIINEAEGRDKDYGKMSDVEFRKERFRSIQMTILSGFIIVLFSGGLLFSVVAFNNGDMSRWLQGKKNAEFYTVNAAMSEMRQDFQIKVTGTEADIKLNVEMLTNDSDKIVWFDAGTFHLLFTRMTVFSGSVPSDAYVLYYPPTDWYTKSASEKVKYEEIHVPIEKQKVGVDPTFYKDKDYPYEYYPFDEIEITTNKVIHVIETNQTIYDFYVRFKETDPRYTIKDIQIYYGNATE